MYKANVKIVLYNVHILALKLGDNPIYDIWDSWDKNTKKPFFPYLSCKKNYKRYSYWGLS